MSQVRCQALLAIPMLAMLLTGCQSNSTQQPAALDSPHASCEWELPGGFPPMTVAQVAAALESEGFEVRAAESGIGLVSAERSSPTVYHNRYVTRPSLGGFVLGGSGGGFSSGVGISVGMDGMGRGGSEREDATLIEQVSVRMDGRHMQVSRDMRIFGWRGELKESRGGSGAAFCQSLRSVLTKQAAAALVEGQ
ncbi:MAG: hypothetical protein ACTH3D_06010 [Halomonas sp.]|uniref:hypothetical protein n=1 Tax=Halomonas sp. TaxID=1486246 RepID=UPI003F8F65EA